MAHRSLIINSAYKCGLNIMRASSTVIPSSRVISLPNFPTGCPSICKLGCRSIVNWLGYFKSVYMEQFPKRGGGYWFNMVTSVFALGAVRFSVTLVSRLFQRVDKIKRHCENNVMMSKGSFFYPNQPPALESLWQFQLHILGVALITQT